MVAVNLTPASRFPGHLNLPAFGGGENSGFNSVTEGPLLRIGGSGRRHRNHLNDRIAEREREQRIREAENIRIQRIQDEISHVRDSDMSHELKSLHISMLNDQIGQIHVDRAEREQLAMERELMRKQQEIEERQREREEAAAEQRLENNRHESAEELMFRENIRGLTAVSTRLDHINLLSRTRASLASEANMVEQAIGNTERPMVTGTGTTVMVRAGHETPNDFRHNNLRALNAGISRLDTAVANHVGALYRDSQVLQEAQLRIAREQTGNIVEEDENEEQAQHEYAYQPVIDARL